MSHFLVVYDRAVGEMLRMQRYATGADAMDARFQAEAEFRGNGDIEVVALAASSEADLRRTHARYFLGLSELAARMA